MASGSEEMVSPEEETHVEVSETTDVKGDGKKRKFKPLEAMRKLFKSGRKRTKLKEDQQGTIVSQKAKSTPALQTADDDDDDDGGFKNRAPRPLGGARSISEDSVFSPEQRDPSLGGLNKTAISEENLRPVFHDELFNKLRKRQSQYSDEDVAVGKGQNSNSRESDRSLVDSSDNEEEDPFMSNWKSTAPQKPKRMSKSTDKTEPLDFAAVKSTQQLTSDFAKHKLSVRPNKKKASRQSRKHRDVSSPSGLPSLNEESPTKTLEQSSYSITSTDTQFDMSTSYSEVSQADISQKPNLSVVLTPHALTNTDSLPSPKEEPLSPSALSASTETKKDSTPLSSSQTSAVEVEEKTSPKVTRHLSGRGHEGADAQNVVAPSEQGNELSQAFNKVKRKSVKMDEKDPILSKDVSGASKQSQASGQVVSVSGKSEDKVEVKSFSKPQQSYTFVSQVSLSDSKDSNVSVVSSTVEHKQAAVKKVSSEFVKDDKSDTASIKSNTSFKREGLKTTDSSEVVSPGREDYKLKRQSRSKTLPEQPVAKDESYASKIQRANSHRVDFGGTSAQKSDVMTSSAIMSSDLSIKKNDPKRRTWTEPTTAEPEWMAVIRKRKEVSKESENSTGVKTQQSDNKPKEVFTIEVGKDKKSLFAAEKVDSVGQSVGSAKTKVGVNLQAEVVSPSKTASFQSRGGSVRVEPSKPDGTKSFSSRAASVKVTSSKSDTIVTKLSPTEETIMTSRVEKTSSTVVSDSTKPLYSFSHSRKSFSKVDNTKSTSSIVSEKSSSAIEPKKTFPRVDSVKTSSPSHGTNLPKVSASDVNKKVDSKPTTFSTRVSVQSKDVVMKTSAVSVQSKDVVMKTSAVSVQSKDVVMKTSADGTNLSKVSPSEGNKKADTKPFGSRSFVQSKEAVVKPNTVSPWKSNTVKKDNVNPLAPVKIEIIEKEPTKVEVTPKKKVSTLTSETPEKCRDKSSNRSSVLDIVKNFQKLHVT